MALARGRLLGYQSYAKREAAVSIKFHIGKVPGTDKYFSKTYMGKHLKEDMFLAIHGTEEARISGYKIPLWSEEAIKQHNDSGSEKDLRIEHAYPRNLLVETMLKKRDTITVEEIEELLDVYLHGIVVTLDEDLNLLGKELRSNLPKDYLPNDIDIYSPEYVYARYTYKKINVKWARPEKVGKKSILVAYADFIKDGKII